MGEHMLKFVLDESSWQCNRLMERRAGQPPPLPPLSPLSPSLFSLCLQPCSMPPTLPPYRNVLQSSGIWPSADHHGNENNFIFVEKVIRSTRPIAEQEHEAPQVLSTPPIPPHLTCLLPGTREHKISMVCFLTNISPSSQRLALVLTIACAPCAALDHPQHRIESCFDSIPEPKRTRTVNYHRNSLNTHTKATGRAGSTQEGLVRAGDRQYRHCQGYGESS